MNVKSRLPGCAGQAADAAICLHPGENGRCSKIAPKSECPWKWIRLPRHKWPKSWSNIEDSVFLLERNLYGHPLAGLLWEWQFEEILMELGGEKAPSWECLSVYRKQGLFLSVHVDDIQNDWKNAEFEHHEEDIDETGRSWRTNIISWPCVYEMFSTWMQTERKYYWRLQEDVRITNFCWKLKKLPGWEKPHASQLLAWTIKTSRRRSWRQLDICQKYARRWS